MLTAENVKILLIVVLVSCENGIQYFPITTEEVGVEYRVGGRVLYKYCKIMHTILFDSATVYYGFSDAESARRTLSYRLVTPCIVLSDAKSCHG